MTENGLLRNFALIFPITTWMPKTSSNHVNDHCKFSRAFTLLEVLVTLSITGVVLAGATISLARYRRHSGLSRAVLSLKLLVERAYSRALATHQELVMSIEQTAATIQERDGENLERLPFIAPVTPVLKENKPQELRFYPSISSSPATITLRSGTQECSVIISLRGRVRTQCE